MQLSGVYGNNANTHYDLAMAIENDEDLGAWLTEEDLPAEDVFLQRVNVYGAEKGVDEATQDMDGPFWVLITRHWYGPTETSQWVIDDGGIIPMAFPTYQDAEGWIKAAESGTYTLSHNESERPDYRIIEVV